MHNQPTHIVAAPNVETQTAETASSQFPSLTPNQARAIDQLLSQLDPQSAGALVGVFGPKSSGKSTLLHALLVPQPGRRPRTADHRKVAGLVIDASVPRGDKSPWQFLILSVLDMLASSAMPGDRKTTNELRNELVRLIRVGRRPDDDGTLAAAAFAHHFRGAFPRLVQNVFVLSNAMLVVGLDQVDEVEADDAAQWLEAASYFLNAPGCAVLFAADEAALVGKLARSAPDAAGDALLRKWLTGRVDLDVPPSQKRASPAQAAADLTPPAAGRDADIPAACLHILTNALRPDRRQISVAAENWRNAMRAVVRRSEEGLDASITSVVMAKLVALRALSPQLFDAARYDARMLVALERQVRSGARPEPAGDWMTAIDANPRLRALLLEGPELSGLPTRQLATALRLAYGGVDAEAVATRPPAPQPAAPAVLAAGETSVSAAPAAAASAAVARPAARPITVSATTTALVSGGVFLVDRVVKLAATGALQAPARVDIAGAIQLGIPAANALSNTFVTDVFALGAELFGIALALLIMTFWGAARPQKSYSVAFGLILGALAANLFDRLAYGGVLNFIRVVDSPVFNVSHLALLAGALLLAFSVLRNTVARPQESAA